MADFGRLPEHGFLLPLWRLGRSSQSAAAKEEGNGWGGGAMGVAGRLDVVTGSRSRFFDRRINLAVVDRESATKPHASFDNWVTTLVTNQLRLGSFVTAGKPFQSLKRRHCKERWVLGNASKVTLDVIIRWILIHLYTYVTYRYIIDILWIPMGSYGERTTHNDQSSFHPRHLIPMRCYEGCGASNFALDRISGYG